MIDNQIEEAYRPPRRKPFGLPFADERHLTGSMEGHEPIATTVIVNHVPGQRSLLGWLEALWIPGPAINPASTGSTSLLTISTASAASDRRMSRGG